jgi:hypothetical protein
MSLSCLCKRSVAVLVVLVGGLTPVLAGAGEAERGREPAQERYHLYGVGWTRVGPEYTYLGSFCTPERAEAAKWDKRYPEYMTVKSDRLKLPPADQLNEKYHTTCQYYVWSTSGKRAWYEKQFCTAEAAAVEAEAILGSGESFRVLYFGG